MISNMYSDINDGESSAAAIVKSFAYTRTLGTYKPKF